jgi:hypothetical protein
MATPADQRLLELLEKWLTSLELHARYSSLDDDSYWKIQPWIEHQRPSRWIIDLARQKTVALKAQVEERIAQGDATFSESLELMIFLANLVGAEHIERFIPMADPQTERVQAPPAVAKTVDDDAVSGTREMPKMLALSRPVTPPSDEHARVARVERKASQAAPPANAAQAAREQVVADAVRLVQWGRKWFELPELIARMAGRPSLAEVRRLLKENKPAIDSKAAGN